MFVKHNLKPPKKTDDIFRSCLKMKILQQLFLRIEKTCIFAKNYVDKT